jgi:signal transduction histidine kinase
MKISLSQKLTASFLFISLFTAVIGGLFYRSNQTIKKDFQTTTRVQEMVEVSHQIRHKIYQLDEINDIENYRQLKSSIEDDRAVFDSIHNTNLEILHLFSDSIHQDLAEFTKVTNQTLLDHKSRLLIQDELAQKISNGYEESEIEKIKIEQEQLLAKILKNQEMLISATDKFEADEKDIIGKSTQETENKFVQDRNIVLSVSILALLISVIFGHYISLIILKPIQELTLVAKSIAQGNIDQKIQIRSNDEVGLLAASFNEMTVKLKQSYEELEQKVADRTHDLGGRVKELKIIYGLSKIAEEEKENLDNVYQRLAELIPPGWQFPKITCARVWIFNKTFQSANFKETQWSQSANVIVSGKKVGSIEVFYLEERPHLVEGPFLAEERNLINSLAGSLSRIIEKRKAEARILELNEILKILNKILRHDILNDLTVAEGNISIYLDHGEPKDVKELLGIIVESVSRGKDLINKMRDLEKTVSTGQPLGKIDVGEVVNEAKKEFENLNIKQVGNTTVMADTAFSSVFTNLFRNALDHGKASEITITISEIDSYTEIKVADNGKGIPDEIKSQIFKEGAKFGETGNTGLGLYIINKTIERYGGSISVENNKPKGVVFIIRLSNQKHSN